MAKRRKALGIPGPAATHPWAKWLGSAGSNYTITRGRDFHCQIPSMMTQIRQHAAKKGLRVSVQMKGAQSLVITNHGARGASSPRTDARFKPKGTPTKAAKRQSQPHSGLGRKARLARSNPLK